MRPRLACACSCYTAVPLSNGTGRLYRLYRLYRLSLIACFSAERDRFDRGNENIILPKSRLGHGDEKGACDHPDSCTRPKTHPADLLTLILHHVDDRRPESPAFTETCQALHYLHQSEPRQMASILLRFDKEQHAAVDPFVSRDKAGSITLVDPDGRC